MFYVKNVPVWERLLRGATGAAVVIYALLALEGTLAWLAVAAAAVLLLSGIFGFCPACAMVGRRLKE
jgi:hypothetical protein